MQRPLPLTLKQKRVLDFIEVHFKESGLMPSRREIAQGLGYSSVATVQEHVDSLAEKGLIERFHSHARGLEIVQSTQEVPLLGNVAAGYPIEVFAHPRTIEIPPSFRSHPHQKAEVFALKVSGESMRDDGILDGDVVFLKKQDRPKNGDTVVALINGQATLKRFYFKNGQPELHPANADFSVIKLKPSDEFLIQGVLIGSMRFYS